MLCCVAGNVMSPAVEILIAHRKTIVNNTVSRHRVSQVIQSEHGALSFVIWFNLLNGSVSVGHSVLFVTAHCSIDQLIYASNSLHKERFATYYMFMKRLVFRL